VKLSATACALSDATSLATAISPGVNGRGIAHLSTTGAAVSIRCTDNAVGTIASNVSARIHAPGETAISLSRLSALVSGFAADAVVEIETTAGTVSVVSGTSRLRLPTVATSELPPVIAIDQEIGRVDISKVDCLQLLEPLAVADEGRSRFYLAGVFWHSLNGQLVAVSTDGIRLIRTGVAASRFSEDRTLIVPTEVGIAVRRLLQKAAASRVILRRSRSLIAFDTPSFSFTARLIDSSFPAYESIIPAPATNSVVCNRLELVASLSRLTAAAPSADTALVALSWQNDGCLDLHLARCPLDGADVVPAEVCGSAEVAVSLPQFEALLKEFRSEHVQLETANEQPVVIRGAGEKLALIVRSKWNFRRPSAQPTSEMNGHVR
jgi:DNA polymerase III sliding clamp (beta) subunit (PCNA family)